MITLTAKISMGATGKLNGISCKVQGEKAQGNNISSEITSVLEQKRKALNPYIIGASKVGDGSTFLQNVDYYIGKEQSGTNGKFENEYIIEVSGENIDTLTIAFDTTNKRHPHYIDVNDTRYYDDDAIYTIKDLGGVGYVKITIDNWNSPQFPLVITGVYVNIDIVINRRNLISLNGSIMSRSNLKLPSYGIISNSGNLKFVDTNGEIKDYAENLMLTSDQKVQIFLNDTITKREEQIAIYETREWDYDNDNRTVSVSLKDDLEEWQDIQVDGFDYDPRDPYKIVAHGQMTNLYVWLWHRTPPKYNMIAWDKLDQQTKDIMLTTLMKYPLLKSGSLWQQWTKICEVCGLYIYKNKDGTTVCTYKYGS